MIYSASRGGKTGISYVEKQLVWAVLGLAAGAIVASIDHSAYARYAGRLYGLMIILLVLVLLFGHVANGARSWIGLGSIRIQPSEFSKFIIIIALAAFLAKRKEEVRTFRTFISSLAYVGVPMLLILVEPDFGTAAVVFAIWLVMVFVTGADGRYILLLFVGIVVLLPIVWNTPKVLKPHQKARLETFVNPYADPMGKGFQVIQSRIAIGSGKIFGKGYLKGTQRELNFVPFAHTDFIFTVVGEEMGFVGAGFLLLLYFALLWRALNIMAVAEDTIARAMTAGVVGMFLFHTLINVGMTLGIMPVTGVPLPMFSYGGSSLMTNMMAIGLLEGISMRRHRISF